MNHERPGGFLWFESQRGAGSATDLSNPANRRRPPSDWFESASLAIRSRAEVANY